MDGPVEKTSREVGRDSRSIQRSSPTGGARPATLPTHAFAELVDPLEPAPEQPGRRIHLTAAVLGGLGAGAGLYVWFHPTSPTSSLFVGALLGALVGLLRLRPSSRNTDDATFVDAAAGDIDDVDSLEMAVPSEGTTRGVLDVDALAAFVDALSANGEAWSVVVLRAVDERSASSGFVEALAAAAADAPLRIVVHAPLDRSAIAMLARPADLELLAPVLVRHFEAALRRSLPGSGSALRAGVAFAPHDAHGRDVVELADRASRRDAGVVVYHDRRALEALRDRDALRRELRRALADAEIVAHYQPIVDARTLAIVGAEALVRWAHPQHGLLAPARFLPLVEDQGAMIDLTGRILDKACRRSIEWRASIDPEFTVVVNVSGAQLRDQWLARLVQHAVERSGVAATSLCFEIELADLAGNDPRVIRTIERLAWVGVRQVVDGVGTVQELDLVRDLPIEGIKLDARRLGLSGDAFLGRRAHDLGQAAARLGLPVHAKRVETVGQLASLRAVAAVTRLQGFALAPPMQRSSFTALAASSAPFGAVAIDPSTPGTNPGPA